MARSAFKEFTRLPYLLLAGHIVVFILALKSHPEWISGTQINPVTIAYFPAWALVAAIDRFADLPSGINKGLFFVGGVIQWYFIGEYFSGMARRAK